MNWGEAASLIRLDGGGHFDPSFGGGDGHVEFAPHSYATFGAVAPDGSVYAITSAFNEEAPPESLHRINKSGVVDRTVEGVTVSLEHDYPASAIHPLEQPASSVWSMEVDSEGRVLLSGQTFGENGGAVLAVARLHSDGIPDLRFGTFGSTYIDVVPDGRDGISYVSMGPDKKLYVAGWIDQHGAMARLVG